MDQDRRSRFFRFEEGKAGIWVAHAVWADGAGKSPRFAAPAASSPNEPHGQA